MIDCIASAFPPVCSPSSDDEHEQPHVKGYITSTGFRSLDRLSGSCEKLPRHLIRAFPRFWAFRCSSTNSNFREGGMRRFRPFILFCLRSVISFGKIDQNAYVLIGFQIPVGALMIMLICCCFGIEKQLKREDRARK